MFIEVKMINLIKTFNEEITKFGFKKNACLWYKKLENVIYILELQKSSYSSLYYLNVSVYFIEIDNNDKIPKEKDCHIRTRLNKEFVGLDNDYDSLFDLEKMNISEEIYRELLVKCITTNIIPQLVFISSKQAISNYLTTHPKFLNQLSLKARRYLDLE